MTYDLYRTQRSFPSGPLGASNGLICRKSSRSPLYHSPRHAGRKRGIAWLASRRPTWPPNSACPSIQVLLLGNPYPTNKPVTLTGPMMPRATSHLTLPTPKPLTAALARLRPTCSPPTPRIPNNNTKVSLALPSRRIQLCLPSGTLRPAACPARLPRPTRPAT